MASIYVVPCCRGPLALTAEVSNPSVGTEKMEELIETQRLDGFEDTIV